MTGHDDKDEIMAMALEGVQDGPLHIAYELRLMANAQPPYTYFTDMPPMIKNIWRAAADFLEETHMGIRH